MTATILIGGSQSNIANSKNRSFNVYKTEQMQEIYESCEEEILATPNALLIFRTTKEAITKNWKN